MSGHHFFLGVSVIVHVVDYEALLSGVLVSPYLSQQLRRFSRKHWAVDEADMTFVVHY